MRLKMNRVLILAVLLLVTGCATTTGPELGVINDGKLSPCPVTPNCVSSDATDDAHSIQPLVLKSNSEAAWQALSTYLKTDSSYTIIRQGSDYLRAEARTPLFRFVDDVEFHLRAQQGQIAMRSASRFGYSDLGTNRRRLEGVRKALREIGVLGDGS